jgi:hypothetical protein
MKREEDRNRELSERVISEAANAQALSARVSELEKQTKDSHRRAKHEE